MRLNEEIRNFREYKDGTVGFAFQLWGTREELLERFSWSKKVREILERKGYEKDYRETPD